MPVTPPSDVPDLFDMEIAGRVVAYARERGLDPEAVLDRLDIDPVDLGKAEIYLDAEQFYRLQADLADALNDPTFGFGLAEYLLLSNYGLIGVLHQKSDDIASAMRHTATLLPRFLVARIGIVEDDTSFTVTYANEHNDDITWVHRQEVLGGMVLNTRKTTGANVKPLALRLRDTHATPAQIRAAIGVDAEVGATDDEVVFPRDAVYLPSKTADPITLPFLLDAVDAQIQRRRAWAGQRATLLQLEGCTVDLASGRVQREGGAAWLTSRERELLEFFAARPNQVVTHAEIEQAIWHLGSAVISHAPAVAIRRLRQKIEPKGSRPVNLLTMFGDGWKLVVRT